MTWRGEAPPHRRTSIDSGSPDFSTLLFFSSISPQKYDAENYDPGLVIRGQGETALTAAMPPHPGLEGRRARGHARSKGESWGSCLRGGREVTGRPDRRTDRSC